MAESNIVKGSDKAVAWYAAGTMPVATKAPSDVAGVIRSYITLQGYDSNVLADFRNADWRWEDMADAILSSQLHGVGPTHASLKHMVLNAGEGMRSRYQRKEQWIAAFGAGKPQVSDAACNGIYDAIRAAAWLTLHMPHACAFTTLPDTGASTGKASKKIKVNVPKLA